MTKKLRIDNLDENFIINSFRQDDTNIPPEARSTEVPTEEPAVEEPQAAITATSSKPELERKNRYTARKETSRIMKVNLFVRLPLLPDKGSKFISAKIITIVY